MNDPRSALEGMVVDWDRRLAWDWDAPHDHITIQQPDEAPDESPFGIVTSLSWAMPFLKHLPSPEALILAGVAGLLTPGRPCVSGLTFATLLDELPLTGWDYPGPEHPSPEAVASRLFWTGILARTIMTPAEAEAVPREWRHNIFIHRPSLKAEHDAASGASACGEAPF